MLPARPQTEYETNDERLPVWGNASVLPSRASLRGSTVFLKPVRINKLVVSKEMLLEFKQVRNYVQSTDIAAYRMCERLCE